MSAGPRLSDLSPDAVAAEVWGWVQGHVGRLLMHGEVPPTTWELARMAVHAVATLTHWAQHGGELDATPAEYLQSVAELLWTAAHPDVYSSVDTIGEDRDDASRAINVVIRAALARDRIGGPPGRVPLHWLAALASIPYSSLRTYVARGELEAVRGEGVRCSDARRWLEARGVPGFGTNGLGDVQRIPLARYA